MFAYCNNNPVMYSDADGEFPWLAVIVIAVCTIAGGTLGYMYDDKLGEQSLEEEDSGSIKPLPPNHFKDSFSNKSEQIDLPPQDNDSELSVGDRVKNTLVGAGLGLAAGGAVVATGGAAGSIAVGSATTYIALFGGTGAQTFAIGAVAYDLFALVIAPFFGLEMETIEIEP